MSNVRGQDCKKKKLFSITKVTNGRERRKVPNYKKINWCTSILFKYITDLRDMKELTANSQMLSNVQNIVTQL